MGDYKKYKEVYTITELKKEVLLNLRISFNPIFISVTHSNGKRNCFHSWIGSLIEHNEKLETDDNK